MAWCLPCGKTHLDASWVLFSGGWCFLILAAFYIVVDIWRLQAWAFPLKIIGMNSIAAYCMAEMSTGFIRDAMKCHLGSVFLKVFTAFDTPYKPYESLVIGMGVLLVLWLILYWMYRKKLFLRI